MSSCRSVVVIDITMSAKHMTVQAIRKLTLDITNYSDLVQVARSEDIVRVQSVHNRSKTSSHP